jgi:hypothetical protein
LYRPENYAQFAEPPQNKIWSIVSQERANNASTILNFENLQPEDLQMNARYDGISRVSSSAMFIRFKTLFGPGRKIHNETNPSFSRDFQN